MNADALYEILKAMPRKDREKTELRGIHQPSWPLQEYVAGVVTQAELIQGEFDRDMEEGEISDPDKLEDALYALQAEKDDAPKILYIVLSGSPHDTPYAPRAAWELMRTEPSY